MNGFDYKGVDELYINQYESMPDELRESVIMFQESAAMMMKCFAATAVGSCETGSVKFQDFNGDKSDTANISVSKNSKLLVGFGNTRTLRLRRIIPPNIDLREVPNIADIIQYIKAIPDVYIPVPVIKRLAIISERTSADDNLKFSQFSKEFYKVVRFYGLHYYNAAYLLSIINAMNICSSRLLQGVEYSAEKLLYRYLFNGGLITILKNEKELLSCRDAFVQKNLNSLDDGDNFNDETVYTLKCVSVASQVFETLGVCFSIESRRIDYERGLPGENAAEMAMEDYINAIWDNYIY